MYVVAETQSQGFETQTTPLRGVAEASCCGFRNLGKIRVGKKGETEGEGGRREEGTYTEIASNSARPHTERSAVESSLGVRLREPEERRARVVRLARLPKPKPNT